MYKLLKPLLFLLDAETAHNLLFSVIERLQKTYLFRVLMNKRYHTYAKWQEKMIGNLLVLNPVGIAAGLDKNARLLPTWALLKVGFVTIGTVTPRPQVGNPRPRLFRLPKDKSLINRMGFNNEGVKKVMERLIAYRAEHLGNPMMVGASIGPNKEEMAQFAVDGNLKPIIDQYLICMRSLILYVDYFEVNISSPNTPGLRGLQEKEQLLPLLEAIISLNNYLCDRYHQSPRPIFLKVSPDMTVQQLRDVINVVNSTTIEGFVCSNTTNDRKFQNSQSTSKAEKIGAGGLSGDCLYHKTIRAFYTITKHSSKPIIAVGGITTPDVAEIYLNAGASAIQIYTGLIYEGPGLIRKILNNIAKQKENE